MEEIWKDIEGYEGLYQVSSEGRVRSLDRVVVDTIGRKRIRHGQIMKPCIDKDGYKQISLSKSGHHKCYHVYRLVAFAFPEICGEYFEGAECNHKNEDKSDNRAVNLEWCTRQYNYFYGSHLENIKKTMKKNKKGWKEVVQCDLDGNIIAVYPSLHNAAEVNGYNTTAIWLCCSEKYCNKTYKGFIWRYAS